MRKKNIGWRELTEDGDTLEVRAVRGRKDYNFQTMPKNGEEWEDVKPTPERLEKLLEILDLRYRRRKGSLKEVEVVQGMLRRMRD